MIRPWFWLPAKVSHALSGLGIEAAACLTGDAQISQNSEWKPFTWKGLQFKNPLGIAGGLDKNAEHIRAWQKLGAGFIEIGTVTPKPQKGNPGPVIDRDLKQLALWNRMGFPSKGSDYVFKKLSHINSQVPLFVNIGKNRDTSLEGAGNDYISLAEKFRELADVLVVNISSPNTPGLRSLANVTSLQNWLGRVIQVANPTPVLLKLSPDMSEQDFKDTVLAAAQEGIAGFILTNTTLSRTPGLTFPQEGGVSGLPLKKKSLEALDQIQTILGSQRSSLLIVSCGGVMTADDVFDRLKRGADLVQTYSALVFNGPGFLKDVALTWKMLNQKKHG
jgi:dihydroorotate dehydrogenase